MLGRLWRLILEALQLLIAPLQWLCSLVAACFEDPAAHRKKRSRRPQGGQGAGRSAANAGWAYGKNRRNQAAWLVDCHRMRLEDDSNYGGCNWHGMNDPDATQDSITEDFLIFCKLAVLHEAIPPDWDWDRLLRTAAKRLHYHFDKDNAIEAWGCAIALRHTAEVVHGVSMLGPGRGGMLRSGGDDGQALERVTEQVQGRWQQLVAAEGDMFEDVGGVQAWKKLHSKLYFERE